MPPPFGRNTLKAQASARPYAGGMYWKKEGGYEYLVKTNARNRQERMGARSAQTEQIYDAFHKHKAATQGRLDSLTAALIEATQDVDWLWDARKRVQFVIDLEKDAGSVLAVLKRADPSFRRKSDEGQNEGAVNDKGFEVDFIRREAEEGDPHPFRFSADEDALWPVRAKRASVLTQSPLFIHPVISATGRLATMRTVDPRTFVAFKRWMAEHAQNREPLKRRRDLRQAQIVQELLYEGLVSVKSRLFINTFDE